MRLLDCPFVFLTFLPSETFFPERLGFFFFILLSPFHYLYLVLFTCSFLYIKGNNLSQLLTINSPHGLFLFWHLRFIKNCTENFEKSEISQNSHFSHANFCMTHLAHFPTTEPTVSTVPSHFFLPSRCKTCFCNSKSVAYNVVLYGATS